MKRKEAINGLIILLKPYKRIAFMVFIACIASIVTQLYMPYALKKIIDDCLPNNSMHELVVISSITLLCIVITHISLTIRFYYNTYIGNCIVRDLREKLYKHFQELPIEFFEQKATGNLINRIIGDITNVKLIYSQTLAKVIPNLVETIVILIIILFMSKEIFMIAMIASIILLAMICIIKNRTTNKTAIFRDSEAKVLSYIYEVLQNQRLVKKDNLQDKIIEKFDSMNKDMQKKNIIVSKYADLAASLSKLIFIISISAIFVLSLKLIENGIVTIGSVIACITYLLLLYQPMQAIVTAVIDITREVVNATRAFEILNIKICDESKTKCIDKEISGKIKIENLNFKYPNAKINILDGINLEVSQGDKVAIVGETGSGKTTLVSLIAKLYDYKEGKIFLDEYELRDYSLSCIRKNIGIMNQETYLFEDTILENIRYGKLDASDEEIKNVVENLNIEHVFKRFSDGIKTRVSDKTKNISEGERQLIGIARIMLQNPKILILDEATANIDTKMEIAVKDGIEKIMKNRTTLCVAHRLSTVKNSDVIIVMDKGKIIEKGKEEELIKLGGCYSKMVQNFSN